MKPMVMYTYLLITLDSPRVAGCGNVILHEHWKDTKLTFFVKTGLFLI